MVSSFYPIRSFSLPSADCLFSPTSDGLVVTALAKDQGPDVGQGWMDCWVAGRGAGSVCSGLEGLCVPSMQLPLCGW